MLITFEEHIRNLEKVAKLQISTTAENALIIITFRKKRKKG